MRTKEHDPEYFKKCLQQRLAMVGKGSFYPYIEPDALEDALMVAIWNMYDHPNVAPGCHAFISYSQCLHGFIGVVPLEMVPSETKCYLIDVKDTGTLSLCIKTVKDSRWPVAYTVLITGDDGYGECMFTFHPGDPLKPSTLSSDGSNEYGLKDGDEISVEKAISIGFKHAKLI
jgi:hypothetical protein